MRPVSVLFVLGVLVLPGCFFFGITDNDGSKGSDGCQDTAYGGCDTGSWADW